MSTRNLDEFTITDATLDRVRNAENPRIRQVGEAVVRHLHALVREIEPTFEEWSWAIRFPRHPHRQAVQRAAPGIHPPVRYARHLHAGRCPGTTASQGEATWTPRCSGSFYVQGPPEFALGADIAGAMRGDPLFVDGTVTAADGKPLAGALVDVWQSDDDGFYDVQQLDKLGELAGRARFRTDANGRFYFWTIRPSFYPIPDDGTVGQMLKAQGRHPYRPAHVHFMIENAGYVTLVTHVFDAEDKYLDSDAVFGVKDSLIRD